ncbi:MAG: exonuclease domain-containing protein [Acidimicrobiales bacterium]
MRQIVLDTETTGLEVEKNHRIIEIGCIELLHRRATGRTFHRYLNPERDIDAGAQLVHGLTPERLAQEPKFAEIAPPLLEFIRGAELVVIPAAGHLSAIEQPEAVTDAIARFLARLPS